MNIVAITREDGLLVPVYLTPLVEKYREHISIVVISGLPPYINISYIIKSIYYYGIYYFCMKFLQLFLFRIYSLFSIKKPKRFFSVKDLAKYYKVEYRIANDIQHADFIKWIISKKPDILLSVMSPIIFKKKLLDITDLAINIHPSLLPKYKGIDPLFWAMKNNERFAGVTIHIMEEKVDSGRILMQKKFQIKTDMSLFKTNLKAAYLGGKMLVEFVHSYKKKYIKTINNIKIIDKSKNHKIYKVPTKNDLIAFNKINKKLLTFSDCLPI